MTDDTDRPYKTLAEALAMADRHRALGISVSVEAIRETLDRVAQLEAALGDTMQFGNDATQKQGIEATPTEGLVQREDDTASGRSSR